MNRATVTAAPSSSRASRSWSAGHRGSIRSGSGATASATTTATIRARPRGGRSASAARSAARSGTATTTDPYGGEPAGGGPVSVTTATGGLSPSTTRWTSSGLRVGTVGGIASVV